MLKLLRKQLVQRKPQAQSRQAQKRELILQSGSPRMASSAQMQGAQRKLMYCGSIQWRRQNMKLGNTEIG